MVSAGDYFGLWLAGNGTLSNAGYLLSSWPASETDGDELLRCTPLLLFFYVVEDCDGAIREVFEVDTAAQRSGRR